VNRLIALAAISVAVLASTVAGSADKPGPFVFMYGLQGPQAASTAQRLGLNALYWQVRPDDLADLPGIRSEIAQAAAHNVPVIVALPTVPEIPRSVSLADDEYVSSTKAVIANIVSALKEEPGVVGWATGDYLERAINYSSLEFREYLRQRYGSLEELNSAWNCAYPTWGQITLQEAQVVDDDLPFGVGRPSVDAAEYKRQTFQDIMAFWAGQVRSLDPDRLLFTGRISLYRSLTAIPDQYDIVVPAIPPAAEEPATYSHNIHTVDMARRGGRFAVVPALSMPMPPDPLYAQHTLRLWIAEAGLHGAAGVGLQDYQRIANSLSPAIVAQSLAQDVKAVVNSTTFSVQSRPTAAILYEPYAAGFAVGQVPAYGYINGFSQGEPNNLFAACGRGSRLGLVDCLTIDDLATAQLDLNHYSFIAAPLALHLPAQTRQRLAEYVERGGVLIADLGAGMYQTGSWQQLPAELARMCGVTAIGPIQEVRPIGGIQDADAIRIPGQGTDIVIGVISPHFPSLRPSMRTVGQPAPLGPTKQGKIHRRKATPGQLKSHTLTGPIAYAAIRDGALPLGVSSRIWQEGTPYFSGIIANDYGLGVGIFATSRLWANWWPGDPVFVGFHGDLWARRAEYELQQPGFWLDGVAISGAGDTVYLLNTTGKPLRAAVAAYRADSRLYQGALCQFSAAARLPSGKRSGAALLSVDLPLLQVTGLRAKPVQIQPYATEANGRLLEYSTKRIKLEIAGPGARLFRSASGETELSLGHPTTVRVTIQSGLYAIESLSWHQVEIDAGFKRHSSEAVQADPQGRVRLDVTGQRATVEICPAPPRNQ